MCSIDDENLYANDDLDYLISMVRLNEKSLLKTNSLKIIHDKTMNTIRALCKELRLEKLADKIEMHYKEVRYFVDHGCLD